MAEELWRGVAAAYDRSFATLCAGVGPEVVRRLGPGLGDGDVLDVGCGTGRLTALLAAAGHRVSGVDPDPAMLALARERVAAPLTASALPELHDVRRGWSTAVAAFVLNHVDDPAACAAGLAQALRPGGRAIATIWPVSPPPHAVWWGELLDAADAVRPEVPRLPPERDFARTPDGLGGLLSTAGLEVVEATACRLTWRVAPEDLWAGLTAVGNFGVVWRAQDEATRARVRAAYDDAVPELLRDGTLAFEVACVLVEAIRPGG